MVRRKIHFSNISMDIKPDTAPFHRRDHPRRNHTASTPRGRSRIAGIRSHTEPTARPHGRPALGHGAGRIYLPLCCPGRVGGSSCFLAARRSRRRAQTSAHAGQNVDEGSYSRAEEFAGALDHHNQSEQTETNQISNREMGLNHPPEDEQ
jgi:hypothetical protein